MVLQDGEQVMTAVRYSIVLAQFLKAHPIDLEVPLKENRFKLYFENVDYKTFAADTGIALGFLHDGEATMEELESGVKGRKVVQVVTGDASAAIKTATCDTVYCENPEALADLNLQTSIHKAAQFYLRAFIRAAPEIKDSGPKTEPLTTSVRHLLLRLYAYLSPGSPLVLMVAYLELLSALLPYLAGRPMATEREATTFSPEDGVNV